MELPRASKSRLGDVAYYQQNMPTNLTDKQRIFYDKYTPFEGVNTAGTLGGFFIFVVLLVMYKSKMKPMWKERQCQRAENSRAEAGDSGANGVLGSLNEYLQKDLECIPLTNLVHSDLCEAGEEEEFFYHDDTGNFVFPLLSPGPTFCSCPNSSPGRRPSQVSALSTAYTVKSLPGAMLYIPVENDYNTPVSLKRSLSDPEIYFPSAVRHSLIVAVNGILPHERPAPPGPPGGPGGGGGPGPGGPDGGLRHARSKSDRHLPAGKSAQGTAGDNSLQIDINVIQPTPNISPAHSLRSFSIEDRNAVNPGETFAGIPFLIVPPSPVRVRRVSFSDHSVESSDENDSRVESSNPDISISAAPDEECQQGASTTAHRRARCVRQASLQAASPDSPTSARRRRSVMTRQLTLPCSLSGSMSYLQVPGQEARAHRQVSPTRDHHHDRRLRLPSGGIDEVASMEGGSPVLVRRRFGQQASVDSYYSFASEGDGDIFASAENVGERRGQRLGRQTSFCIPDSNISEYSEFNEDFFSSISELFVGRQRGRLENQGTFSEQCSIRSLSIDQEEITFELPTMQEQEEEKAASPVSNFLNIPSLEEFACLEREAEPLMRSGSIEGYISSSCSISMSSDLESSHQITVPVFVEPAPPEAPEGPEGEEGGGQLASYWREEAANRLVHQETMHTDSGLDTEEICPASPYGGRYSAEMLGGGSSPLLGKGTRQLEEEGVLRMVLVRDIGIQCCADSPRLDSTRGRKGSRASGDGGHTPSPPSVSPGAGPDEAFAAELLF